MNNTLNCFILHQKCRFLTKEKHRKSLICSVLLILNFGSSGATGNRTRDTRIFSPLLYQLSYGTSLVLCKPFRNCGAKIERYFEFPKLHPKKIKKSSLTPSKTAKLFGTLHSLRCSAPHFFIPFALLFVCLFVCLFVLLFLYL